MPDHCFCEAIRDGWVLQPANTISGLAFVGVGVLVWRCRDGTMMRPIDVLLYSAASVMIGLGTMFYHASLTFWGQTVDVLGMYLVATFVLLHNLTRLFPISDRAKAIGYVAGNALLLTGLIYFPAARRYLFAMLVLLAIALETTIRRRARTQPRTHAFAMAVTTLAVGFAIWVADITRVLCVPQSWLQGHALWHVAGAGAVWFVFVYLKYESTRD